MKIVIHHMLPCGNKSVVNVHSVILKADEWPAVVHTSISWYLKGELLRIKYMWLLSIHLISSKSIYTAVRMLPHYLQLPKPKPKIANTFCLLK